MVLFCKRGHGIDSVGPHNQSLTNVSPKSSTPQKKRVIEYLVMENRLYNTDGWYVRDQMYEGVRGTFTKVD